MPVRVAGEAIQGRRHLQQQVGHAGGVTRNRSSAVTAAPKARSRIGSHVAQFRPASTHGE